MDTVVKVKFDLQDLFHNVTQESSPDNVLRVKATEEALFPIRCGIRKVEALQDLDPTHRGAGPRGL